MRVGINSLIFVFSMLLIPAGWYLTVGFIATEQAWWAWLFDVARHHDFFAVPSLAYPLYAGIGVLFGGLLISLILSNRAGASTISGERKASELHGTARWAKRRDVRRAGLMGKEGVVIGGWKGPFGTRTLRHNGPEHIMAFAPTRSGKGVSIVVPTLLEWEGSALVLDIKGENYALTSGYRARQGQRIVRFEPAAESGSCQFNPLAEIRLKTDHEIQDAQNIAAMVVDVAGASGNNQFWSQSGAEFLAACILHVLYRVEREEGRIASLGDVRQYLYSPGQDVDMDDPDAQKEVLNALFEDMKAFDHGREIVDLEVKGQANNFLGMAHETRTGIMKNALFQLGIFADPIVARNLSGSDFRLSDLMEGDKPLSLYLVVSPRDMERLKPLLRILITQVLTRLTEKMEFEDGAMKAHYKHRLLLMMDEFSSLGKLDIYEQTIAFMAGYGLKSFIIVQDITQLRKAYGDKESLFTNSHIRIAFAPNQLETARLLSDLTGVGTIIQKKRSRSSRGFQLVGNVSDSVNEVRRTLLTPDECMRLPLMEKGWFGRIRPGDMLIFAGGMPPVLGKQKLFFQNKEWLRRTRIPPPVKLRSRLPLQETVPEPEEAPPEPSKPTAKF